MNYKKKNRGFVSTVNFLFLGIFYEVIKGTRDTLIFLVPVFAFFQLSLIVLL